MRMDCNVAGSFLKRKRVGFALQQFFDEMLKEMASRRDRFCVRQLQLAIVFDEHRIARGFEKEDRRTVRTTKEIKIVPPHFIRVVEISLAEGRSAAAFPALRE